MSHSTEGPTSRLNHVSIRCVANNAIVGELSLWIACVCMVCVCSSVMGVHFKYEFDVLHSYFMCAPGILGGSHVLIMTDKMCIIGFFLNTLNSVHMFAYETRH